MTILASCYPYVPGEIWSGCIFTGDEQAGQSKWGFVQNAVQTLKYINKLDLKQYDHTVYFDDGTIVTAHRNDKEYWAEVYVPPRQTGPGQGQFYHVPGCVARYCLGVRNDVPSGDLKDEQLVFSVNSAKKTSVSFLNRKECGLPSSGVAPDGSILRDYKVISMPGTDTSTLSSEQNSGIGFTAKHIPSSGPFSISFVARLNKKIEIDYSFSEKSKEIGGESTIWNPIRPRILKSDDGETWSATCPGSLAPLLGRFLPLRFSKHWAKFTFPWPPYNSNFVSEAVDLIGFREVGTSCADEPTLESEYSPASPYWDKVVTGSLETLSGEFLNGWAENAETVNTAPYASFCRFQVGGSHSKPAGTRAVGVLENGEKRYSTVVTSPYDEGSDTTTFTLKDHQWRRFMTDAKPEITFGDQPFPVCNPRGYMIGMNFIGLAWYNGNSILAGKVCDYETEYNLSPTVSNPLDVGEWYHVCMTYDDSGESKLYISKSGSGNIQTSVAKQSTAAFECVNGFGSGLDYYLSGADYWDMEPEENSQTTDWKSSWIFSSCMDIGLIRFYHRALSMDEARALLLEAFHGVFVADDHEAAQLVGAGLVPVTL